MKLNIIPSLTRYLLLAHCPLYFFVFLFFYTNFKPNFLYLPSSKSISIILFNLYLFFAVYTLIITFLLYYKQRLTRIIYTQNTHSTLTLSSHMDINIKINSTQTPHKTYLLITQGDLTDFHAVLLILTYSGHEIKYQFLLESPVFKSLVIIQSINNG